MGIQEALGEGLWRFGLRTPTLPPATSTNTLVVEGSRSVAVIEPGCPYEEERHSLIEHLEGLERAGKALQWIVLTHQHIDHIGGAQALQARFGGRLVAHPHSASRLPFAIDVEVNEGDSLDLGEASLEFVFTPGHAPGHLVVWLPEHRIAHGGDLVASEGTILVDLRDGGDMAVYIESLRRVTALFEGDWAGGRLVPAHGQVVDDPSSLCRFYIQHRLAREAKIVAAIGAEPTPVEEVLRRAYSDKDASILPLARFALDAHVAKLVREGRAVLENDRLRAMPG